MRQILFTFSLGAVLLALTACFGREVAKPSKTPPTPSPAASEKTGNSEIKTTIKKIRERREKLAQVWETPGVVKSEDELAKVDKAARAAKETLTADTYKELTGSLQELDKTELAELQTLEKKADELQAEVDKLKKPNGVPDDKETWLGFSASLATTALLLGGLAAALLVAALAGHWSGRNAARKVVSKALSDAGLW